MSVKDTLGALAFSTLLLGPGLHAQELFGTSCAGASGITPVLFVAGPVMAGQSWTLEVTAPGGVGLGYLLVGFSNTNAGSLGGAPLPIDLGTFLADPLWSGCALNVDPSYTIQPYAFDPNTSGGLAALVLPGFDFGTVFVQAVNVDADFVTRIAGVSRGLAVRRTAPDGMVAIEPGTFQMGSNAPNAAPYYDATVENDVHTVTLSYPFWIGQHEVTQAQYSALMGSNPSAAVGPDRPVERVTWSDAQAYCAALTVSETLAGNVPVGYEYRLPTEAEWEYACRAGTTTEFNVGAELLCDEATFGYSYHSSSTCDTSGTADVGGSTPNAWGLYDMHGNVWEWCLDSYAAYPVGPEVDPFVTGGAARVFRGGSFVSNSSGCRSAFRLFTSPGTPLATLGFRIVLAPIRIP